MSEVQAGALVGGGKNAAAPSVLQKINAESRGRAAQIQLPTRPPEKSTIDFTAALRRRGAMPQLIAELKRRSPSKGSLKEGLPAADAVRIYEPYAAALSILTEPNHFHGSLDDLREARSLTALPLLRKDFIVDEKQIDEARHAGASSFLLIVASLTDDELKGFTARGRELGMEPLVEVLTEEELYRALALDIRILGINNRNLHTLEIDMNRCPSLAAKIPAARREELVLVAESGYSTREELLALPHYFDAVLMGTGFMQASDPAAKIKEVFG
ncbi:MAG TPA: indole-3-glycerol phosphate synthase TrpC [Turneriella sp.]|nr:indole-3-glycerol phosphate synthase TrpC [Turneriella sp.]